ncbi:MAG TPA: hypothetical protein PLV83_03950 [Bacilli bacterium]|nr:hypothetical protein [Bacilli bacterium]
MTYIYDILLNYNTDYYEFFEWNKDDPIIHIKKIPVYKIKDEDLKNIMYNDIIFEKNFLMKIKNRTEIFLKRGGCNIEYACLLCGKEKIIGIKLNKTGKIIEKSDLLVDEYGEIFSIIKDEEEIEELNYIINAKDNNLFITRKSKEINNYIRKELESFNMDKLSYIYYEFFLKNESIKEKMIEELMNIENKNKLYKMIKLINNKYKKIK